MPAHGSGYEDVPLDDEVAARDSTSYVRRDLMMLVQYAAAKVGCEAAAWKPGNGGPLALGDMSDHTGAIPGTATGRPRHPAGTHVGGRDIDLAYFQTETADNHLRSICTHVEHGADHHHCIRPPTTLDARRTALLIGALFESPHVRIIGVDGAAAPPIEAAISELCADHLIAEEACARARLAYETTDTGYGWFYAHHNHIHVSWQE